VLILRNPGLQKTITIGYLVLGNLHGFLCRHDRLRVVGFVRSVKTYEILDDFGEVVRKSSEKPNHSRFKIAKNRVQTKREFMREQFKNDPCLF
jgi:hypothetical protein